MRHWWENVMLLDISLLKKKPGKTSDKYSDETFLLLRILRLENILLLWKHSLQ